MIENNNNILSYSTTLTIQIASLNTETQKIKLLAKKQKRERKNSIPHIKKLTNFLQNIKDFGKQKT